MLDKIRKALEGKKTYLVGIAAILGLLIEWVNTGNLNVNLLVTAIIGMTIRAGVTTTEK